MKRLAALLIRWLCNRSGLSPIDAFRMPASTDLVERGQRWESFYREQGGIADMLKAIRVEAFEAAGECRVDDTASIHAWAIQDRNIRKLQARIEGVVTAGKLEQQRRETAERAKQSQVLRAI